MLRVRETYGIDLSNKPCSKGQKSRPFLCGFPLWRTLYYEDKWLPTLNCCEATLKTARKAHSPGWCSSTLTSCIRRRYVRHTETLRQPRTLHRRSLSNWPEKHRTSSGIRRWPAGFTPASAG